MTTRLTRVEDIPALKLVLDETGLFPSELLTEMLNGFLSKVSNNEIWLTAEVKGHAVGFCYTVAEKLMDGTWNMLAIAVLPSQQGDGIGSAIVTKLEDLLREQGHRLLIADTSGTEQFAQTREFYRKRGYTEEARIRNFWADKDDKVTFARVLNQKASQPLN